MTKMEDIEVLVEAYLEANREYIDIVHAVRMELGESLRSSATWTNSCMVRIQRENKFPTAQAYSSPLYLRYK